MVYQIIIQIPNITVANTCCHGQEQGDVGMQNVVHSNENTKLKRKGKRIWESKVRRYIYTVAYIKGSRSRTEYNT